MIKMILVLVSLFVPTLCFSNTILHLPSDIIVDPNNPADAFSEDIKQYFLISANLNGNDCKKKQGYMLAVLIYRNVVDNKTVSTYRAEQGSSLCWIDLISYSDKLLPDMTAGGWKAPKSGQNTWCSVDGLRNPLLCALLE